MLKKKLYSEILKQALTRIQVMRLFTELYHPKPAIRIINRNYHQKAYTNELVCDQCGKTFEVITESYNKLLKEQCICPHCGFSIEYQLPYYKSNLSYVVDDYKKEYGYIFDGDRLLFCLRTLYGKEKNIGFLGVSSLSWSAGKFPASGCIDV